jgi:hypothetical protein
VKMRARVEYATTPSYDFHVSITLCYFIILFYILYFNVF